MGDIKRGSSWHVMLDELDSFMANYKFYRKVMDTEVVAAGEGPMSLRLVRFPDKSVIYPKLDNGFYFPCVECDHRGCGIRLATVCWN